MLEACGWLYFPIFFPDILENIFPPFLSKSMKMKSRDCPLLMATNCITLKFCEKKVEKPRHAM